MPLFISLGTPNPWSSLRSFAGNTSPCRAMPVKLFTPAWDGGKLLMCLLRVTSLAGKVWIIRDKAVCPSPFSWQLQMSYVKMLVSPFPSCSSTPALHSAPCYSQHLQKVGHCPREGEVTNEGNIMGHLDILLMSPKNCRSTTGVILLQLVFL